MPLELGLQGRSAVISGGSKGIGKGIARRLAAEGVNVVLLARGKSSFNAPPTSLSLNVRPA